MASYMATRKSTAQNPQKLARFGGLSLRQLPCDVISPSPRAPAKNASIRAVHAPKLMTEPPAPEPGFVSLRPPFSKAPDFGKPVRIFKAVGFTWLFALENPYFCKFARMGERIWCRTVPLKSLDYSDLSVRRRVARASVQHRFRRRHRRQHLT